jgi:DNA-binding Lrp family transcriptional regulator
MQLDGFDLRILAAVQQRGDISHVDLAERVHLSPTQCARRLERLKEQGYIRQIVAILDPELVGLTVVAHSLVSLRSHDEAANAAFRKFILGASEVVECYSQTGDADFLMKVMTRDLPHLSDFVDRLIAAAGGLASLRSSIVLKTVKKTTELPLPH